MERLHARYPFLDSATDAVEAAGVDLLSLVEGGDDPVVDRAVERVETALSEGTVGAPRRPRVELLSYPVARVLVSLLDEPRAVRTYASAEATTARERFEADIEQSDELRSTGGSSLSLSRLCSELDLDGELREHNDGFAVAVSTYLRLAGEQDDDQWRLVERSLTDGYVRVERRELYALLETAVAERVADGLPLAVPEEIAVSLDDQAASLQGMLTSHDPDLEFAAAVPELFPPCMDALVERAQDGETLPPHASFALVSFLAGCSLDSDEIVEFLDDAVDPETIEYQYDHVYSDRGIEYAPPSCATMDAYGICVNKDERCDRITHPGDYYDDALDADGEQFSEWTG